jgi:hypothetical protein
LQNKFTLALITLSIAALTACHNGKEVQTETVTVAIEQDTVSTDTNDGSVGLVLFYKGVIKDMSQKEGCGFMIVIQSANNEDIFLEPDQLDDAYKVDGKIIEFTFTDSRRPTKCTMPCKPITMGEIKN